MRSHCFVALTVVFAACRGTPSAEQPRGTAAATASGPQPVIAVELWPARWSRVVAALPAPAREAIGGRDLWDLAREGAAAFHVEGLTLPPPGLAPDAPIAVELYAPRTRVEDQALAVVRAAKAHGAPAPVPLPQVRIAFQATDPAALAAALRAARAPSFKPTVSIAGSRVTLELAFGDAPVEPLPPAPPVTTFESSDASAARAIARIDDVGTLGTVTGLQRVAEALGSGDVRDERLVPLVSAGTSEALVAYLLFDPSTTFARAIAVDVPADEARPPRFALDLGDAGKTALAAAGLARGKTATLGDLAWPKAIAAAPMPAILAAAPSDQQQGLARVATLFHECGGACFFYPLFGNVLALAHAGGATMDDAAEALAAAGNAWATVKTFQLAWTDDDLAVILPTAAPPPRWKLARTAPPSAAQACYLRALVPLRTAIADAGGSKRPDRAAWDAATTSLAGAESCTKPDADLTARLALMRQLATELAPAR